MWRCFHLFSMIPRANIIFSTYVEVFLKNSPYLQFKSDFLHVCGGVSEKSLMQWTNTIFSPRMWRCFSVAYCFPGSALDFLHVCGGVSSIAYVARYILKFSPRMWRCFFACSSYARRFSIFSTYVEVFPWPRPFHLVPSYFLHVCGGVSIHIRLFYLSGKFSPRMWRCFFLNIGFIQRLTIFSTYVEVFPILFIQRRFMNNFLHVCGGVSWTDLRPV